MPDKSKKKFKFVFTKSNENLTYGMDEAKHLPNVPKVEDQGTGTVSKSSAPSSAVLNDLTETKRETSATTQPVIAPETNQAPVTRNDLAPTSKGMFDPAMFQSDFTAPVITEDSLPTPPPFRFNFADNQPTEPTANLSDLNSIDSKPSFAQTQTDATSSLPLSRILQRDGSHLQAQQDLANNQKARQLLPPDVRTHFDKEINDNFNQSLIKLLAERQKRKADEAAQQAQEEAKPFIQRVGEAGLQGIEGAVTAVGEGARRFLQATKEKIDNPLSIGKQVSGSLEQVLGGLEVAIGSVPAVAALNVMSPVVDLTTRETAKSLGIDEEAASGMVQKALPFVFGKWVGLGSISSEAITSGIEESGVLDGMNPKNRRTTLDLIRNGIFLGVATKGQAMTEALKEKKASAKSSPIVQPSPKDLAAAKLSDPNIVPETPKNEPQIQGKDVRKPVIAIADPQSRLIVNGIERTINQQIKDGKPVDEKIITSKIDDVWDKNEKLRLEKLYEKTLEYNKQLKSEVQDGSLSQQSSKLLDARKPSEISQEMGQSNELQKPTEAGQEVPKEVNNTVQNLPATENIEQKPSETQAEVKPVKQPIAETVTKRPEVQSETQAAPKAETTTIVPESATAAIKPPTTAEEYKSLVEKLRKSSSFLGVNPAGNYEYAKDLTNLGLYHIKNGITKFNDWKDKMISDLNEKSIGEPKYGSVMGSDTFEEYLSKLPLKDSFGKLDYSDIKHIAGAAESWTLKAIDPNTKKIIEAPDTKSKFPIVMTEDGDILDGRRRWVAAANRGDKAILAWVGEYDKKPETKVPSLISGEKLKEVWDGINGKQTLYHYSNKDLSTVDPNFQGSGQGGAEMKRAGRGTPKTSAWYTSDVPKTEDMFGGSKVYGSEIPKSELYHAKEGETINEQQLQKAGWKGYSKEGQVRLFENQPVRKLGNDIRKRSDFNNVTGQDVLKKIGVRTADDLVNHLNDPNSDYAIMTAENPQNTKLSPRENAARNTKLKTELEKAGYNVIPVEGNYGGMKEHSFYVPGMDAETAKKFGLDPKGANQESVITSKGLEYKEGTMQARVANQPVNFDKNLESDYSTMKIGDETVKFQIPYDWENKTTAEVKPTAKPTEPSRLISVDQYEQLKKNIISKSGNLTAGIDPTLMKDYALLAAYHIETGVRTLGELTEKLVKDFGEKIRPYAKDIWDNIKDQYKDKIDKGSESSETPPSEPPVTPSKPESSPVEGKVTKAAADINRKLVEKGFSELPEEELAKYPPTTKAKEIDDVTNIMNNLQRAKDLATSKVVDPNIRPSTMQVLYNSVKIKAAEENDFPTIKDLAVSKVAAERSVAAQTLGAAGFNNWADAADPVEAIKSVVTAREKSKQLRLAQEQSKKYEKQIKDLESKIAAKDEKLKQAQADRAVQTIKDRSQGYQTRQANRVVTKETLKAQRADLYTQLFKVTSKVSANPFFEPEAIKIMGRLVDNYFKEGITTASGMADTIYNEVKDKMEGVTRKHVLEAIAGAGREAAKTKTDLQNGIADLKKQATLLNKIEDLMNEESAKKKETAAVKPSETLLDLQNKYRELAKQERLRNGDIEKYDDNPDWTKLENRKEQIRKKQADYEARIDSKDYAERAKVPPPVDAEMKQLQSDLKEVRDRWNFVQKTVGKSITDEEAAKITELAKATGEAKTKMIAAPRREVGKSATPEEMAYGYARVDFASYVDRLRESANKLTVEQFKADPMGTIWGGVKHIPGMTKSLKATLDNSGLFNQHLKTLYTHPTVWARNAKKSFQDIIDVMGKKDTYRELSADMVSRPNYENYIKDKLAVGVIEEAFPDSKLLEKIPYLGRLHQAADAAFTGLAYRNRADIYDLYTQIAKEAGNEVTTGLGIGKLANALTGRGDLGSMEKSANKVNVLLFSPRFVKSHIEVLTAHGAIMGRGILWDRNNPESFMRKEAAKNLIKIVAGSAAVMATANALLPGSVEDDPRSADFGSIRVGNTRFHFMGGMNSLVTLASRIFSRSTKTTGTDEVKDLNTGGFGARTALDVLTDFASGKLAPVAGVARDLLKGQQYGGQRLTLGGELTSLAAPLPITNTAELLKDPKAANLLAGVLADAVGIFTSTYSDDPDVKRINNTLIKADVEKMSPEAKHNFRVSVNKALRNGSITDLQAQSYLQQLEQLQEEAKPKVKVRKK